MNRAARFRRKGLGTLTSSVCQLVQEKRAFIRFVHSIRKLNPLSQIPTECINWKFLNQRYLVDFSGKSWIYLFWLFFLQIKFLIAISFLTRKEISINRKYYLKIFKSKLFDRFFWFCKKTPFAVNFLRKKLICFDFISLDNILNSNLFSY